MEKRSLDMFSIREHLDKIIDEALACDYMVHVSVKETTTYSPHVNYAETNEFDIQIQSYPALLPNLLSPQREDN